MVLVVPDSEAGGGWQFGAFILKDSEVDMKVDEEAKGYMWLAAEEARGLIYSRIWQEKIMGLILSTIVTNYSSQDSLPLLREPRSNIQGRSESCSSPSFRLSFWLTGLWRGRFWPAFVIFHAPKLYEEGAARDKDARHA